MKTTIQHDQRNCGAACLHMIAKHYGLCQPIARYRELTKTDKNGTSIYGIIGAAKKIGLKGKAMLGSLDELIEDIDSKTIVFPFIAHIITENNMQNFVVIAGYKNGSFTMNDPSKGKSRISADDFYKLWTGYIVTFKKTKKFKKQKSNSSDLVRFFKLLINQYRKIILSFIIAIIISIVRITGSFIFHLVIDNCPKITESHEALSVDDNDNQHESKFHVYEESDDDEILNFFESVYQHSLSYLENT